MKKILMMILITKAMLAIGCAKQKENTQTNDIEPRLIKGRVVKSIQLSRLEIIIN